MSNSGCYAIQLDMGDEEMSVMHPMAREVVKELDAALQAGWTLRVFSGTSSRLMT